MGHQITALIGKLPIKEEEAKEYDLPVVKEGGYAIVGLNASHSDFWSERLDASDAEEREIILDCGTTHFFASALFGKEPYAIVETDYFGGVGDQAAAVYREGTAVMPTEKGEAGPINKALRLLGVKRSRGLDEFDSIGLGSIRHFDEEFEKYWEEE